MLFSSKMMQFFKGNSFFFYKFGLQIPNSWSTLVYHYTTFKPHFSQLKLKATPVSVLIPPHIWKQNKNQSCLLWKRNTDLLSDLPVGATFNAYGWSIHRSSFKIIHFSNHWNVVSISLDFQLPAPPWTISRGAFGGAFETLSEEALCFLSSLA